MGVAHASAGFQIRNQAMTSTGTSSIRADEHVAKPTGVEVVYVGVASDTANRNENSVVKDAEEEFLSGIQSECSRCELIDKAPNERETFALRL